MNNEERYRRQTDLPQIGHDGQQKLRSASILVIGAGGLGCPAMQYLAGAGIGRLIIVDFDRIDISNLNRQVLFTPDDIGDYKAEVAARKLKQFNPQVIIETVTAPLSTAIAAEHLPHCDLVLDCTDRPDVRYLINDLCVQHNKPFIYAGIYRFEGQLAVFNLDGSATYRCAFPEPNEKKQYPTCEENGVLGTVPGILGVMQANEAIKTLVVKHQVRKNTLLIFNFLNNQFRWIKLKRTTEYQKILRREIMNEFTAEELKKRMDVGEHFTFVDVREPFEEKAPPALVGINIPTSNWNAEKLIQALEPGKPAIIFCQHGLRSKMVIDSMPQKIQEQLVNLVGGISAWKKEVVQK